MNFYGCNTDPIVKSYLEGQTQILNRKPLKKFNLVSYLKKLDGKTNYKEYFFTWNYFTVYPDSSLIMFLQMFPFETISRETLKYLNYLCNYELNKALADLLGLKKIKCTDLISYLLFKKYIYFSWYNDKNSCMDKLDYIFNYIFYSYQISTISGKILVIIFNYNTYLVDKILAKCLLKDIVAVIKNNGMTLLIISRLLIPMFYTNSFYNEQNVMLMNIYLFLLPNTYKSFKSIIYTNYQIHINHLTGLLKLKNTSKCRKTKPRNKPKLYL
jgi:hypothetical protein